MASYAHADVSIAAGEQRVKKEAFDYDVILEHIGGLGKFQLVTCLWLLVPALFSAVVVMSYSFTGAIPQYRCKVDGCTNGTDFPWTNHSLVLNPRDSCYRYNLTVTDPMLHCDPRNVIDIDPNMLERCTSWTYDTSTFESTIFTDFDLPCDNEWKVTLAGTLHMIGMFVGGLTLGNIADVIGRRWALTISGVFSSIFMTASAWAPNYTTFAVFRFICGIFGACDFDICFVWGIEAASMKHRVLIGGLYQAIFAVGSGLLGLTAYFVRDWRMLQLAVGVPMITMAIVTWFLPESTRWLITMNRYDEARKLILRAAEVNNKEVPGDLLVKPDQSAAKAKDDVSVDGTKSTESFADIFRSSLLRKRLVILFFAWMTVTMCFYGLSFAVDSLVGDFYVNYQFMVLIEIPGYFLAIYLLDKIGRRMTVSGSMLLSGIACLAAGLMPQGVYRAVFSLLGKMFIACCFGGVYSYTTELFPTAARSAAVGLCSTSGRIGGVMAPIIVDLGRNVEPTLPFVIFAGNCIVVALLGFSLPETNNMPLPSNIQEAEDLNEYSIPISSD